MKLKLMVMAALAACVAAAMPTKEEIAKANKEVRESLKAQIAAWKDGRLSDCELSGLMLMHSRKFDDEARRYACLQAAFAAAVRADDAAMAANSLERIVAEVKGFDDAAEKALFEKAFAKIDGEKAKAFRYRLETERVKLAHGTRILDETAATIAKMQMVVIPSLNIKEGTTLADAVSTLRDLGRKYDSVATDEEDKGFDLIVGGGVAYDEPLKVRRLPASGVGEKFETLEITLPFAGLSKRGMNPSSQDLKTLFSIEDGGVLWPEGSSLVFEETSGKLIVKNTCENLGKIEKIMSSAAQTGVPMPTMPAISTGAISFYDAVKTVAESADMKFKVDLYAVYIFPSDAKILKAQYDKSQNRKTMSNKGAHNKVKSDLSRIHAMRNMSSNGMKLRTAIELANRDRKAIGLPSVWPRTAAVKDIEKDDIAGRGFKSAADYFTALFDLKNMGTVDWKPYVTEGPILLGQDTVVKNTVVADELHWCIVANVTDALPDNVPVLVSANFNPALLLSKWDGIKDADKILPIGPASGAAKSIFDDECIVAVYRNGVYKEIRAKDLTYATLYQRSFDASKGNPPLAYLTPTGVAEPTAGKNP